MELAFLLRDVGANVVWVTVQRPLEMNNVIYSLENKMKDRGVKVTNFSFLSNTTLLSFFLISIVILYVIDVLFLLIRSLRGTVKFMKMMTNLVHFLSTVLLSQHYHFSHRSKAGQIVNFLSPMDCRVI